MTVSERQSHWQNVYSSKSEAQVSWTQADPQPSLGFVEKLARDRAAAIIDVGGGASRLVDALVIRGFVSVTVLDLSEAALQSAQARMGEHAASVHWIAADATAWRPPVAFDVWHDRAAFHFLVEPRDRAAYVDRLHAGVKPDGHAIIATFAPDGPERCSGLPVQRYDPASLSRVIGAAFELVEQQRHHHLTPWGAGQSFQYSVLRRR